MKINGLYFFFAGILVLVGGVSVFLLVGGKEDETPVPPASQAISEINLLAELSFQRQLSGLNGLKENSYLSERADVLALHLATEHTTFLPQGAVVGSIDTSKYPVDPATRGFAWLLFKVVEGTEVHDMVVSKVAETESNKNDILLWPGFKTAGVGVVIGTDGYIYAVALFGTK